MTGALRRLAPSLLIILGFTGLACGGANSNVSTAVPATVAQAPGETPASEITAAPERPEAPASLFAVGRIARPSGTWASLEREVSGLSLARGFEPFQDQMDLAMPVDLAWSARLRVFRMTVEPGFAVSGVVRSVQELLDSARSLGLKIEEPAPRVYRIHRYAGAACILDSEGPAPARLVCGDEATDAVALAEYMTHALPLEDLGNAEAMMDVRVEDLAHRLGNFEALQGLLTGWMESSLERRVPSLAGVFGPILPSLSTHGLALARDTRRVRVELVLPTPDVVEVRTIVSLRGQSAWISKAVADQIGHATPAPDAFWRLVPASDAAWFSSAFHEGNYQRVKTRLVDTLAAELHTINAPRETAELLVRALLPHGPTAYAHGSVATDLGVAPSRERYIRERAVSFFGWHVLVIPSSASDVDRDLAAGMDAYNDGRLRTLAYQGIPALCAGLPPIRRRPSAQDWPKGTKLFEMTLSPAFFTQCATRHGASPAAPVKPATIVVALVPDGARSWVGVSGEESVLRDVMKKALGNSVVIPEGLLSPLAREAAMAGGFVTSDAVEGAARHLGSPHWFANRYGMPAVVGEPGLTWWLTASTELDSAMTLTMRLPRAKVRAWSHLVR